MHLFLKSSSFIRLYHSSRNIPPYIPLPLSDRPPIPSFHGWARDVKTDGIKRPEFFGNDFWRLIGRAC